MFTGATNAWTTGGQGGRSASVLDVPCMGPCRKAIRMTIVGRGFSFSLQSLHDVPLPRRMTVVEREGKVLGVMCPECSVS